MSDSGGGLGGLGVVRDHGFVYEAKAVHKSFAGVEVLNDVSVTFLPGEVHSLLGANGAGKSTLLKILAGTYTMDEGELVMEDATLPPLTSAKALDYGIYMVPQEPRVLPDLSIAENIYLGTLPRAAAGVRWKAVNEGAATVLGIVGIHADPRRPAGTLPLAHQQLIECARALVHRCGVIFFDEPTSPLTTTESDALLELISKLRDRNLTIGFISHRLNEIEAISDRMTVLRDGVVVTRETRGSATRDELTSAMVGRAVSLEKRQSRDTSDMPVGLAVRGLHSGAKVVDVTFDVRQGEIVGLAGLVGSGRTEACEAVFGLRKITSGSVELEGAPFTGATPGKCIDHGLVYLSENRGIDGIFSEVSIVQNSTAASIGHISKKLGVFLDRVGERKKAREELLRTTVKAASLDTQIKSLSGGNQQKVLFARWMMTTPKIAMLDEPTRGVDVGAKEGIYGIIEELAASGVAILVICSELEELVRLCDRVYAVYEGRVVGELTGDDITLETIGRMVVGA